MEQSNEESPDASVTGFCAQISGAPRSPVPGVMDSMTAVLLSLATTWPSWSSTDTTSDRGEPAAVLAAGWLEKTSWYGGPAPEKSPTGAPTGPVGDAAAAIDSVPTVRAPT